MVPAGVASFHLRALLALRHSGLGYTGQRIEFAEDTDDRLTGAERSDEGGRDIGYARLNLKAFFAQLLL